ncbi:MAG TPA: DoxX family protein [Polyangiaceae bacterium]|jgi:uncharacterized membrane protein YphA (DoxX/SURF4 family)
MKARTYAYWIATIIIALELLSGGILDLTQRPDVTRVMTHLGYPAYFIVVLGVWKILGAFALILPRFPRLKEWAYAGVIFEMTGAAASHAAVRDGAGNLLVPLVFALIALVSWALRPTSRVVGSLALPTHVKPDSPSAWRPSSV